MLPPVTAWCSDVFPCRSTRRKSAPYCIIWCMMYMFPCLIEDKSTNYCYIGKYRTEKSQKLWYNQYLIHLSILQQKKKKHPDMWLLLTCSQNERLSVLHHMSGWGQLHYWGKGRRGHGYHGGQRSGAGWNHPSLDGDKRMTVRVEDAVSVTDNTKSLT